jgi:beta-xylosidase
MRRSTITLVALLASSASAGTADTQSAHWGDQRDGTYRNPILAGDYSDPDVIRVGDDFYLISSTINMSPGMAVLHSRDLVNWQTIGHVVADIAKLGPELNWDRMNRYGEGVYAGSIRFHDGKFFVHFTSFLEGFFVGTADNPAGPWKVQPMKDAKGRALLAPKWDDPCPFWDDDGQAYLVASKPGGAWYPHLFRMSNDGVTLPDADLDAMSLPGPQARGEGATIYARDSAEGNKLYKRDGLYYFYNNEVGWQGRMAVMRRSRFIYGERSDGSPGTADRPGAYQVKPMLTTSAGNRELNQGGLVDTPDGRWYFLTQGGAGGHPDGRVSSLLPVVWIDGWPMPGSRNNGAMLGDMMWTAPMPITGGALHYPQGSDDFQSPELSPNWEWNHQPRSDQWSVRERKGWLRLHAFKPLAPGKFFTAGNTLGQRYFSGGNVRATIKVDISGVARGQKAGLAHFNGGRNYATLHVVRDDGGVRVQYEEDGRIAEGPALPSKTRDLWLRTEIDEDHVATLSFSTDGKQFSALAQHFTLKWGGYRGTYLGIFTYNDRGDYGRLDVDSFNYEFDAVAR